MTPTDPLHLLHAERDGVYAPYLCNFDGDVCDFYHADESGIHKFRNADANAARIETLWNSCLGIDDELLARGWLFRIVRAFYRWKSNRKPTRTGETV